LPFVFYEGEIVQKDSLCAIGDKRLRLIFLDWLQDRRHVSLA